MRMTNEEFQAEVFRRSQVYMQERRQSRLRFFRGAGAFACCLVLVGGAVMLRSGMGRNFTKILTKTNSACLDETNATADGEHSEECMAENASEESCEGSYAADILGDNSEYVPDPKHDLNAQFKSEGASSSEQQRVPDDEDEQKITDLTAEEYFRGLNVNPLPKKLGGCTLQSDPDARYNLDKYTSSTEGNYTFTYLNGNGEPELYADVMARTIELEYRPDLQPARPDDPEQFPTYAAFVTGDACIILRAAKYDLNDTERMEELANTLFDALRLPALHDLTAEEYFTALNINPLPESFAGCTLKHEPGAVYQLGQDNRFTYMDSDGEPALYAELYKDSYSGFDVWGGDHEPTRVVFGAGQAKITLRAAKYNTDDADAMEKLAKELWSLLAK